MPPNTAFDFDHALDANSRPRRRFHLWFEVVGENTFYVVDKQLLMLHLVFEAQANHGFISRSNINMRGMVVTEVLPIKKDSCGGSEW